MYIHTHCHTRTHTQRYRQIYIYTPVYRSIYEFWNGRVFAREVCQNARERKTHQKTTAAMVVCVWNGGVVSSSVTHSSRNHTHAHTHTRTHTHTHTHTRTQNHLHSVVRIVCDHDVCVCVCVCHCVCARGKRQLPIQLPKSGLVRGEYTLLWTIGLFGRIHSSFVAIYINTYICWRLPKSGLVRGEFALLRQMGSFSGN